MAAGRERVCGPPGGHAPRSTPRAARRTGQRWCTSSCAPTRWRTDTGAACPPGPRTPRSGPWSAGLGAGIARRIAQLGVGVGADGDGEGLGEGRQKARRQMEVAVGPSEAVLVAVGATFAELRIIVIK